MKELCVCGAKHNPESKRWKAHQNDTRYQQDKTDVPKAGKTSALPANPSSGRLATPEVEPEAIIEATIVDYLGNHQKVSDYIEQKDCWKLEKRGQTTIQWIISNKGIRRLAEVAGIAKNYEVKESPNIIPRPENSMLHIVEITIHCFGKKKDQNVGCVHDEFEDSLTMTGEASKLNTRRGGDYLRLMAEKRGYDRAVIRHLGIENVYSEEEANDFEKDEDKIKVDVLTNEDLEKLAPYINLIINSQGLEGLKSAGQFIKENASQLNELQIQYLRAKYSARDSEVNKQF